MNDVFYRKGMELKMKDYQAEARKFLEEARGFRLGFLPSEARNPLTMNLDRDFAASSRQGVQTLLSCDTALLPLIRKIAASSDFSRFTESVRKCFDRGGRVIFSGCGATGRLAILLEKAWQEEFPGDGRVLSIQTGGDFALVRSVENFEDCEAVGALQLRELDVLALDDSHVGLKMVLEKSIVKLELCYPVPEIRFVLDRIVLIQPSQKSLQCRPLFLSGRLP